MSDTTPNLLSSLHHGGPGAKARYPQRGDPGTRCPAADRRARPRSDRTSSHSSRRRALHRRLPPRAERGPARQRRSRPTRTVPGHSTRLAKAGLPGSRTRTRCSRSTAQPGPLASLASVNPVPPSASTPPPTRPTASLSARPPSLFNHDGAGHQQKINKASAGSRPQLSCSRPHSRDVPRLGLTGDDDLHFKVSADGTTWREGLVLSALTGTPRVPSFAKSALPSAAAAAAGALVHVTDEVGGAVLAFSDGAIWRRVTDRAAVS